MTARVLPSPDVFASCPLDGKILEFYAGTFETVFVSLNPFIKPVSIDKSEFRTGVWPGQAHIAKHCEPVSWCEVQQLTGLPSLAAIDIGLRTSIRGLKAELCNDGYAADINKLLDEQGILAPTEGLFPELLYDRVLRSIQKLGYEWLWVGDEFCTERKLHWIDDLRSSDNGLTLGRFNIFTPDKQLLWTIHWDSHFSFICSSAEKLTIFRETSQLEGFLCDRSTEVYWSVH